jgi:hypothetical protein
MGTCGGKWGETLLPLCSHGGWGGAQRSRGSSRWLRSLDLQLFTVEGAAQVWVHTHPGNGACSRHPRCCRWRGLHGCPGGRRRIWMLQLLLFVQTGCQLSNHPSPCRFPDPFFIGIDSDNPPLSVDAPVDGNAPANSVGTNGAAKRAPGNVFGVFMDNAGEVRHCRTADTLEQAAQCCCFPGPLLLPGLCVQAAAQPQAHDACSRSCPCGGPQFMPCSPRTVHGPPGSCKHHTFDSSSGSGEHTGPHGHPVCHAIHASRSSGVH